MAINPLDPEDVSGAEEGVDITGGGPTGGVKAPSTSGFTNVNKYVAANKDQAAGLGNKITQGVQQTASQGLQGLSTAGKEFDQQQRAASVNAPDWSTEKVSAKVQSDVAKAETTPEDQGVTSDIQAFQDVQAKNKAFQGGSDTAAKNLSQIASYSPATQTLNEAKQKATLTGTESGRATLLRGGNVQSADPNNPNAQVKITGGYQKPSYTTGQVNLDQLLTQNAPQNAQALTNLRNSLLGQYGLASQENQAIQNAAASRQGAIQGTQEAAGNIQKVLYGQPEGTTPPETAGAPIPPGTTPAPQYGVLSDYYKQLQNAPTEAMAAQGAALTSAQKSVKDYIQKQYGNQLYGVNIDELVKSIVSNPNTQANITNTMEQPQLNKLQVLNKLAGLGAGNVNQIGLTGAEGTQVIDPNAVGQNKFTSDITSNWGAGQNLLNSPTQGKQKFVADMNATTQSANANQTSAYGQNFANPLEAANYVVARSNWRMNNPKMDAAESQKVTDTLTKQLNNIDQIRQTAGLPAFNGQPPSKYYDESLQHVLSKIADQYTTIYHGLSEAQENKTKWGGTTDPYGNNPQSVQKTEETPEAERANVQAFNNGEFGQWFKEHLGREDWLNAVKSSARALSMGRLLTDLQKNPFIATDGEADYSNFGKGQATVTKGQTRVNTPTINPMHT